MMIHFGKAHPDRPKPWQSDSGNWNATREYVLKRDDRTCADCGATVGDVRETGEPAEVHHKTPVVAGGTDDPENLITLCRDCHNERHRRDELDETLSVFDDVRGPAVTSSDVADAVGCTTEAGRERLARLYERGAAGRREVGGTFIYWLAGDDAVREALEA
jgi:5-methylcytosine-specific restriction endonuclease McrA